jgi:hypothetical protein
MTGMRRALALNFVKCKRQIAAEKALKSLRFGHWL